MKVQLHTNGLKLAAGERELILSGLFAELSHLSRIVSRVNVYLQDCNGPKKGVDKTCRLVIHLRRRPPLVIQDQDAQLLRLIHRVIDRSGQVLQRRTENRRERVRPISISGE
jgi:hypothetical protein